MAERDQLMRPLRGQDAGDAGSGEHVTFRGTPAQDQVQRFSRHRDETLGDSAPFRYRLVRDIDHAGLTGLVQMAQAPRGHCAASRCFAGTPVSRARVASATFACRIRLSPTRSAPTPDAASLVRSAWVKMPLSAMTMRSFGTRGASASVTARSMTNVLRSRLLMPTRLVSSANARS